MKNGLHTHLVKFIRAVIHIIVALLCGVSHNHDYNASCASLGCLDPAEHERKSAIAMRKGPSYELRLALPACGVIPL
jgi:hypothetical protein